MKVLAIDTSSKDCSVAIVEDGKILKKDNTYSEKEHSETLMPMIQKMFDSSKLTLKDMDLLSCGTGPGSFTGIRIGIATVKAFSDANNTPVVGINSLEAQAYHVILQKGYKNCKILSLIDARNENAYFAVYRIKDKNFTIYKNPDILPISRVVDYLNFQEDIYIVGDVELYRIESFLQAKMSKEAAQGRNIKKYEFLQPKNSLAEAIGIAAVNKYNRKLYGNSDSIFPMYLRKPQAERNKEDIDENIYISEMMNKDKEEIEENYDKYPNIWDKQTFVEDTKNSKYLVAKQNNEIIGFIAYRNVLDEIEIMNVVTRKDKRCQGIASDLLSYIIRKGKANKINLEVNEHNITARNLYSKFGFSQVGIRTKYYNDTDDAILMTL